jgi:P-type Mg2+ transporter
MQSIDEALQHPIESFSVLDVPDVFEKLKTTENGLTTQEAGTREGLYGANVLNEEKKMHVVLQFLNNFKNPLVVILLCVAGISFATGSPVNATLVILMVIMSVVLNFLQEFKASKAAEQLREKIATKVTVLRDGNRVEINASHVVAGDIIEFYAGDLIPADCRVISSKDFFVNQASLTGESFPVEKHADATDDKKTELLALNNMVFSGSNVLTGSAMAVVLKTGKETQFGKIAESIVQVEGENEFTRGIRDFSLMILRLIIFFVIFIFFANALIKGDVYQSLMFSIAVAVGLTPEFLPMIMSVTMAKGAVNMAKKGVVVKKLTAIPTFGSMDILCTDKTGTLTQGQIKLVKYTDYNGQHSEKVLLYSYLNSFYQTGIKNPLDEAVLDYKKLDVTKYKKVDEMPFDFNRKRMSVVVETLRERFIITKGAPEEIFKVSKYYEDDGCFQPLTSEAGSKFIEQYYSLSNEGYRVVAVAKKTLTEHKRVYSKEDECELELLGFISFLDPPKPDVKDAIDKLEELEVEVKLITGDNELVSQKICRDIGINIKGTMLGTEIKNMSDEALKFKVNDITIFARFSPDDKNRIITALKANKHVVGYMGDGINDAISLKNADVAISVDNAVDVAKESADIILTRKSLQMLHDGVLEGRKTFGNTLKYIMMGISSNFGNMFSVLGAVLFLPFLPMLPIQILLNNFLYDFSQITIPSDSVDKSFSAKPKRWNITFIKKFMFLIGPISSVYDYVTYILLYFVFKAPESVFQTGWFMESLATQTLVILVIRTTKIPFIQSSPSKLLLITTLLAVTVGWLIPFSPVGKFFGFTPLPLHIIGVIVCLVITYLFIVEFGKRLFYKKYSI